MESIFKITNNFLRYKDVKSELLWGNPSKIQKPLISVIVPVYKRHQFLKDALLSVINQKGVFNYEIIVVDNNDTKEKNDNQEIVESLQSDLILYYKNEENIGMFGNWNRGIELSRGKFIIYCHDDDLLKEDALENLMNLQSHKNFDCIFGNYMSIDSQGLLLNQYNNKKLSLRSRILNVFIPSKNYYRLRKINIFKINPGTGCGSLFRKDVLLENGGYKLDFYPCNDYATNINIGFKNKCAFLKNTTHFQRFAENESFNVYMDFIKRDDEFRDQMKLKMKYPSFLLKIIKESLHNIHSYTYPISWGKVNRDNLVKPSRKDYLILKLFSYYISLLNRI